MEESDFFFFSVFFLLLLFSIFLSRKSRSTFPSFLPHKNHHQAMSKYQDIDKLYDDLKL